MNRQTTGLVLCALLLTTFGHELVNRRKASNYGQGHAPVDYKQDHYHNRDHNSTRCVCEPTGNGGSNNLTVIVNTTTSLVAVVNATAKVALVVDVKANLVVGLASSGVVSVNLETKEVLYVPAGSSNAIWNGSDDYLGNLTDGLDDLLKTVSEKAKHFNVSNVPDEVLAVVYHILIALGSEEGDQKEAVAILVEISVAFRAALSVSLKVLQSGSVAVHLNLRAVVNIFVGLAKLIGTIPAKITIDLHILLGGENAVAVFVSIVAQLAKSGVKLAEALGDTFKSFESLFERLAELGGNSTKGLNGLIKVVVELVNTLNEKSDPETFIHFLIEYYTTNGDDQDLSQQWNASIKAILRLIQENHLEEVAKDLVEVLHKIQENKWTINGVNVSAAIAILIETKANSSPLENIVKIVKILGRRSLALVLITVLLRLLTIPGGIRVIISLAPLIRISIDLNVANVLRLLLRGVVIPITVGNVLKILLGLPIIGDLLRLIQKSLGLRLQELIKHPECGKVRKELIQVLKNAESKDADTSIDGSASGDNNGQGSGDGHVDGGVNVHGDNSGGSHPGSTGDDKGDESGSKSKESHESGSNESGGHHNDGHGHGHHNGQDSDESKNHKERTIHSRHRERHQGHVRHNKAEKNHKERKNAHEKHLNGHK